MFKQSKQEIESWLRGLIAEQVAKIDRDLSNERAALCSTIRVCDAAVYASVNATNQAVTRLEELSHFKENAELRAHIRTLESGITEVSDLVKKLHPSLVKK